MDGYHEARTPSEERAALERLNSPETRAAFERLEARDRARREAIEAQRRAEVEKIESAHRARVAAEVDREVDLLRRSFVAAGGDAATFDGNAARDAIIRRRAEAALEAARRDTARMARAWF